MEMKWTPEQQKVIELRDRNILVSAAAGSGKTAVLVERILGKLTRKDHPIDIDQLLIVTFTRAAAGEMRERLTEAVENYLEQDPENEHLIQAAISELTKGKTIVTIAHRLATIEQADQILVVDNGQIVQRGTHRELVAIPGKYKDFVDIRSQSEGWKIG